MTQHTPAVVLSHGPGGLGTVRALARRGVRVTAIAFEPSDRVLRSRLAFQKRRVAGNDDEERERSLLEVLRALPHEGAALFATSDRLVAFMGRHQEELLQKFRFRLPPPAVLEALNDKRLETELMASLGIPIPATVSRPPREPGLLEERLRYPIIFKPHVYSVQNVFPLKNAIVRNHEELLAFYDEWRNAIPVLLAQEVIPGPDSASWICSCTYDDGHRLLDCGIKQKLRAWPAHFGGSTFAVSKSNAEILEQARILGQKLEYVGHAGIEFRWDERDREYKYIEWNPRIPANVGFDEACGMHTVWNSYRVALEGRSDPGGQAQKDDVYYFDMKGDYFSQRADGASRAQAFLALFSTLVTRRTNGPYFAWDDPLPGIVVAWQFLTNLFRPGRAKAPATQSLTPEQT